MTTKPNASDYLRQPLPPDLAAERDAIAADLKAIHERLTALNKSALVRFPAVAHGRRPFAVLGTLDAEMFTHKAWAEIRS